MTRRLLAFLLCLASTAALAGPSHAAQRPLPAPSDRPLPPGPKFFVDAARGDDANAGALETPWRTIAHGLTKLKPGDTLVLCGGIYRETVVVAAVGGPDKPITLRSYPGELVIMDGGLADFFDDPAEAWEPFEGGAPGEYRSKKAYPELGQEAHPRRYVYAMGNFADSMVPLHGYRNLIDLRWPDMYRAHDHGMSTSAGMYCGPGVWYDAQPIGDSTYGTKKIHIRLAHTEFPALVENNYKGETDPRKLPLVIAGPNPVLHLQGAKHFRVQDLVFRGSRAATVNIEGGEDIELDGVVIYGGAPALALKATQRLRLLNSALRGVSAPWSSRGSEKYRGVSTYLVTTGKADEASDDIEMGWCEFTDCHDGLLLLGIKTLRMHHSLVHNFNDDGLEFGPKRAGRKLLVHSSRVARCLLLLTLHGSRNEEPSETGSGVYVFRNVIDQREPLHYSWPRRDGVQEMTSHGSLVGDHGGPTWPGYYFYHNTVLIHGGSWRNYYGAGMARATRDTRRRVFNNLILHLEGLPGFRFAPPDHDWQADGQLHWTMKEDAIADDASLAALFKTANRKQAPVPADWGQHDILADPKFVSFKPDWRQVSDLRLGKDSPAIDAGVAVPADWPDPQREKGAADIGALPHGAEPWGIGVRGRLSIFTGRPR